MEARARPIYSMLETSRHRVKNGQTENYKELAYRASRQTGVALATSIRTGPLTD